MKKIGFLLLAVFAMVIPCVSAFAQDPETEIPFEADEDLLEELKSLIDLTDYEVQSLELVSKHEMKNTVLEADVEGITLTLGMPCKDVIDAGFETPEGFSDQQAFVRLSTSGEFRTADGKKVEFGFTGENGSERLIDGSLSRISQSYWLENPASVTIGGIRAGDDLKTLVDAFGAPKIISLASWKREDYLHLRYACQDNTVSETFEFFVSMDGKVVALSFAGTLYPTRLIEEE